MCVPLFSCGANARGGGGGVAPADGLAKLHYKGLDMCEHIVETSRARYRVTGIPSIRPIVAH